MPNTEELAKMNQELQKMSSSLEIDLKEIKADFEVVENKLDNHADILHSFLQWRDSNGGPGAEERLRCAERFIIGIDREKLPERVNMAEANIIALQKIADSAIMESVNKVVKTSLDTREKTAIAKLKAWGPILAAIAGPAAAIIIALLK